MPFAKKVGMAPSKLVKRVAVDLFNRIIDKTPVDTGRARASWNISVNEADRTVPPEGQVSYPKPQAPLGMQVQPGDSIVISNNLPYIVKLEEGHSKQAPHGMVALSIAEVNTSMGRLMAEGLKDAGL